MTSLRFSVLLLVLMGFVCIAKGNSLSALFGKSDNKNEVEDKTPAAAAAAPVAKSIAEDATTTTSSSPSSSCGGLKGFLHICDKTPSTEPPKSVKTRSINDDDSDESDSDSDSNEDDNDEKERIEETSSVANETTGKEMEKRQVEDADAPVTNEQSSESTEEKQEDEMEKKKKRQVEDSDSDESEESRERRDCRDRYGDFGKDCKKK